MAIPRFEEDLAIISKLGDNPGSDNNLTTDAFRAKFDEGPQKIQQYLNEVLIPAAEQSSSPQEGLNMQGPIIMNGQPLTGLKHPVADNDAATKKYAQDYAKSYADSLHRFFIVTVPAAGWSDAVPYTQTISMEGITKDDTPHWSVVLSADRDTALAERDAFAVVDKLETADGSVTFTCLEDKPEVDLTIQLEVTRGSTSAASSAVAMMVMEEGSDAAVQAVIDGVNYNVANAGVNSTPTTGTYDFTIL